MRERTGGKERVGTLALNPPRELHRLLSAMSSKVQFPFWQKAICTNYRSGKSRKDVPAVRELRETNVLCNNLSNKKRSFQLL